MLSDKQIIENYQTFLERLEKLFPERWKNLSKLYEDYAEKAAIYPAAAIEHFHNAFNGGYIDHVLRVMDFAEMEYDNWKRCNLITDNFTLEELLFAAAHHDLGKLGMLGYEPYQPCTSKWHIENQGKLYERDKKQPFMLVPDMSLFILQSYGVPLSWSEFLAIRTHDGVYDRANEAYYFSSILDSKSRTNINQILHIADFKAARFEFERWAKANPTKFEFYKHTTTSSPAIPTPSSKPDVDEVFKQIFGK